MFRRRRHAPPVKSPLELAQDNLSLARQELLEAQARRAAAGNIALSLAERQQRIADVRRAIGRVATAKAEVANQSLLVRDTSYETYATGQIPEARKDTTEFGRQAAQLIQDKITATGDKPHFTITAAKSKQWDDANQAWVPQGEVKGWLLFDSADAESVRNYPTGSARFAEWAHYYHGVFLTEDGELGAFYGLNLPYTPGNRRSFGPINLTKANGNGDQPELQVMSYDEYRTIYTHKDGPAAELRAEYATQQQISELLDRQRITL